MNKPKKTNMFLLQFNYTHVIKYVGVFALYNFSLSFFLMWLRIPQSAHIYVYYFSVNNTDIFINPWIRLIC